MGKPRHFVHLKTNADIIEAFGQLYVPCDATPAYWRRTTTGDHATNAGFVAEQALGPLSLFEAQDHPTVEAAEAR